MANKVKKKTTKKSTKKVRKKPKYVCYDCGTEVFMDCCGVGFTKLICCGKKMDRK
ncbi:hypothetical protein GOV14_04795 [Candidatus Pacearchaeota archaeon]|nr:hypothetical protein [Candidatus Pacearchaeota archaeon]